MRTAFVGSLVLATLALVMALVFALPIAQGEHGGHGTTLGGKTVSERTSGAPASEGGTHEASVEVLVTGDPGVRFSGEIETPNGVRSIEGTVPKAYPVAVSDFAPTSDWMTATLRKEDPEGTLEVQVISDGRMVASQETSARDGFTRVTWSLPE